MDSLERDELIARWRAICKQLHILRKVRAECEDGREVEQVIQSLFDRLDEIERHINRWDDP